MVNSAGQYVHGYHQQETERLHAQAGCILDLLHSDTAYPAGSLVLEVGCGTGAQTVTLATNSPAARIVSIDHSASSLAQAEARVKAAGVTNVEFRLADVLTLPAGQESFDHLFVCFVLEHLSRPAEALRLLKSLLKPGGTITVFEGDHGSACFYPYSDSGLKAIACQVELQHRCGGNALIGRELYPLLVNAGFAEVHVAPRMVYVDGRRPDLADGFTRRTFTAMIEGVREPAIDAGLIDPASFDEGIRALTRTAEDDGVFCYTFFKAVAWHRTRARRVGPTRRSSRPGRAATPRATPQR